MEKIDEIKEKLRIPKTDYTLNTGDVIKKFRTERGVSQLHLGLAIGSSAAYISKLETNKKTPSLPTIVKITDVLEIDPIDFFIELFKTKTT